MIGSEVVLCVGVSSKKEKDEGKIVLCAGVLGEGKEKGEHERVHSRNCLSILSIGSSSSTDTLNPFSTSYFSRISLISLFLQTSSSDIAKWSF